ncbi:hypothetical protein ACFVAJ_19025 [Agromyces sp. NPDC057679]|uniref:hypothetical protein n=1 Tax=Agromyces sp. NPDC057679 TaxID=3346207 RepID=UPI00366A95A7
MARTKKDEPIWVAISRPENIRYIRHNCGSATINGIYYEFRCDAEDSPVNLYSICRPVLHHDLGWTYTGCWGWKRRRYNGRSRLGGDRNDVRVELTEFRKQHRGGQDIDDGNLVGRQRRHNINGWWAD